MELDDDGKLVFEVLKSSREHGAAVIVIEIRDHAVYDVKETKDFRRGKEFAKKD